MAKPLCRQCRSVMRGRAFLEKGLCSCGARKFLRDLQPFRKGQWVLTTWPSERSNPERLSRVRVLRCWRRKNCASGWAVAVRFAEPCPTCGHQKAEDQELDSGWFTLTANRLPVHTRNMPKED